MKTILLFGAGKSATVLIDYLVKEAAANQWHILVADANREQILAKTNNAPATEAIAADINDAEQRQALIKRADIVISMMPPALHILVARDCIDQQKHLLTASYIDPAIKELASEIADKGLIFLYEMGLDPGIDHMSAMKLFDEIRAKGGHITSLKSHCGGLVAPESDDNPWHYKISWNPRNVVLAGKAGAVYKDDNEVKELGALDIFHNCETVSIEGLEALAAYPNRDSLSYIPLYHLENAATFIRTTLRYPAFCKAWNVVVQSGLTSELPINNHELTYKEWSAPIISLMNEETEPMFRFLGFFEENAVPANAGSSADILQFLLETKLKMQPHDKDMIVMLHEIGFELNGKKSAIRSSLVVKGEDSLRTAMAKTVGLPLGIAAKLILEGKIVHKGLQIPVSPSIYLPVLEELDKMGISFSETED